MKYPLHAGSTRIPGNSKISNQCTFLIQIIPPLVSSSPPKSSEKTTHFGNSWKIKKLNGVLEFNEKEKKLNADVKKRSILIPRSSNTSNERIKDWLLNSMKNWLRSHS